MVQVIGIYLRLSDEDGDAKESNSIQGQREMIYDFISKNSELCEYKIMEFCDDGFSGTDFLRPGVTELVRKAQNGEIFCIIVKDFSRFGRSYLEVGSFLEQIFPFLGIRFISINDHFDSSETAGNREFIGAAFQNLIYDLYSKDLSQKITSARRSKAEQGKFITAFAPYGYQRSKEQRLIVDQETAPVVKRIFDMALQGITMAQIARILNEERVPSPFLLRKMRQEKLFCHCVNEEYMWHPSAISKILKDQRYVGDGVYGRVKPKKVGSGMGKDVPKEEWVVVPNAHEEIVKREVFEKINTKRKKYQARKKSEIYPLCKKVQCAACNHTISRKISGKDTIQNATYCCTASKISDAFCCYTEKMEEQCITNAILFYLNQLGALVYDKELQEKHCQQVVEKIRDTQGIIKQLERMQKKLALAQMKQYEAYRENKLDKKKFLENKRENQKGFEKTIKNLEQENERLIGFRLDLERLKKTNKPYYLLDLNREAVEAFVYGVMIEKNGSLRIGWNFKDVFQQKDEI